MLACDGLLNAHSVRGWHFVATFVYVSIYLAFAWIYFAFKNWFAYPFLPIHNWVAAVWYVTLLFGILACYALIYAASRLKRRYLAFLAISNAARLDLLGDDDLNAPFLLES